MLVVGCGEIGYVIDDVVVQGDQGSFVVMLFFQQGIEDQLQGFLLFVGFVVGQYYRGDFMVLQCFEQGFQIERSDCFVVDYCDLVIDDMWCELVGVVQQVFIDVNGIVMFVQIDVKCVYEVFRQERVIG